MAAESKPQAWFVDTSFLVTLAVHLPLRQVVVETLSSHYRVLVKAVATELEELSKTADAAATWAGIALAQLDWLGQAVNLDDPIGVELAAQLQAEIAGARPLKHPMEHFGEAAIISLASRAHTVRPLMLSDDYDARIAAKKYKVEPFSVHKFLHLLIKQGKIAASEAAAFADALYTAGRHHDYTEQELASGRLSRVGQP
jgi:hypothetical protein